MDLLTQLDSLYESHYIYKSILIVNDDMIRQSAKTLLRDNDYMCANRFDTEDCKRIAVYTKDELEPGRDNTIFYGIGDVDLILTYRTDVKISNHLVQNLVRLHNPRERFRSLITLDID